MTDRQGPCFNGLEGLREQPRTKGTEMARVWKEVKKSDSDSLVGFQVKITGGHGIVQGKVVSSIPAYDGFDLVLEDELRSRSLYNADRIAKIEVEGVDYGDLQPMPEPTKEEAERAFEPQAVPTQVASRAKHSPSVAREVAQGHSDIDVPKNDEQNDPALTEAVEYLRWKNLRGELNDFLMSVLEQFDRKGSLSEKQIAAVGRWKDNDRNYGKFTQPASAVTQVGDEDRIREARKMEATARKADTNLPKVPEGHYAIEEEGELHFFKVDHGKTGSKWEGFVFLSIQASDEYHAIKNRDRKTAILAAIANDPKAALARYGHEIGRCGVCNRTLTDPESIAIGIGPVCREGL